MKNIIIFIQLGMLLCMSSCNFLNVEDEFNDMFSYDSVFANKRNVERYLWATAANFPDEGKLFQYPYTPGPLACDEAFTTFGSDQFLGMGFVLGEITPDNSGGLGNWGTMYKIIRKSNLIFSRIDEAKDLKTTEKLELLAYTRFMRAYAYYNLLMDFGPLVILGDEVMHNNASIDYYNTHRATYDESVEYVCGELEAAAVNLPITVPISQFGRPTKGAAYGLIARLRLQHASPLYNGGSVAKTYFGSWRRSVDNAYYVSQTENVERWALAAAACARIMNMGLYELHTIKSDVNTPKLPQGVPSTLFPEGAGGIDPFRSYSDMFTGETVPQTNPEYIWGRMSGNIADITRHSFNGDILGGFNGMCVPQKVIDKYKMADGRSIQNSSSEYPYSEDGMTNTGQMTFSGYTLNTGISNMYANREMRFYASIGFSRRYWTASSTSDTRKKNITVTYDKNGNSGRYSSANVKNDYPSTGYVITKYIHESDAWSGEGAQRVAKGFPIIRYAEILLSYAEALNNLGNASFTVTLPDGFEYTAYRNLDEIAKSFNRVRYRAGLPGLTNEELEDPVKVQEQIVDERMIEFLFENRRYYDVRRWGIYEESETEPITGMDIESAEPEYYNRVIVNHSRVRNRVVNKKMIFLPISRTEIRKVKDLDQNPGWAN